MTTPMSEFRAEFTPDGVVWAGTLDQRYLVEVQRTGEHTGLLCVFDHDDHDKLIHEEPVTLAYGATFGPDIEDVHAWQDKIMAIIDGAD